MIEALAMLKRLQLSMAVGTSVCTPDPLPRESVTPGSQCGEADWKMRLARQYARAYSVSRYMRILSSMIDSMLKRNYGKESQEGIIWISLAVKGESVWWKHGGRLGGRLTQWDDVSDRWTRLHDPPGSDVAADMRLFHSMKTRATITVLTTYCMSVAVVQVKNAWSWGRVWCFAQHASPPACFGYPIPGCDSWNELGRNDHQPGQE
jgi:hypothetical protein